ncbi:response regulator transcription factor [Aeromonas hydrophila subsp. hydrophila]|nr:response regulator transcription factor [Aeromonas hydrophila subsp. hydrophila]
MRVSKNWVKFNKMFTLSPWLSDREMNVFLAICQGKSNKDIAENMLLSEKTISTYKTRLMKKLAVENMVELLELAKRTHII